MNYAEYYFLVYALLVPLLSDDCFFVRDGAHYAIEKNLSPFILLFKSDHPEGQKRLRQIQTKYRERIVHEWYEKNKDTLPWAKLRHPSYDYMESWLNDVEDRPEKREWPRYRRATALYIRDYLDTTMDFQAIPGLLKELADDEAKWWAAAESYYTNENMGPR